MYNLKDIYQIFRRKQGEVLGRGYRLPKDWEKFIEKFNKSNLSYLIKLTDNFNTKWCNINPDKYMECGFSLFNKTFTYRNFIDEKILMLYVQRDKTDKRIKEINKQRIISSVKHILSVTPTTDMIHPFQRYATLDGSGERLIINDFITGLIDKYTLCYLIRHGYFKPTADEFDKIQLWLGNNNHLHLMMDDINKYSEFFKKIEDMIDENRKSKRN